MTGARLEALYQFVRQMAAPPSPCEARRQQALALLQAAGTGERLGLSARQFERRFAAHWGMPPKQFRVVARLNSALWLPLPRQPALVELAAGHGYYDQSHMARDVRRLAGDPLQALVQGSRAPLNAHWPLQIGAQGPRPPPCAGAAPVQRHDECQADAKAGGDIKPAPSAQAAVRRHPGGERQGGQVHVKGHTRGQGIGKGIRQNTSGITLPPDRKYRTLKYQGSARPAVGVSKNARR